MLIKDEHFRKLYKNPIIIKDKGFSHEMARSILLDSVWQDGLSGDEIREKIDSIEIDEKINSTLAVAYIDHTAGMSFHIMTSAIIENDHAEIVKRKDFSVLMNCRKDKVNDCEFEYLENLNVNDDFDIDDYAGSIEIANSYSPSEDIEALRFVEILDASRHADFPDDVGVLFLKEGLQIEKMWVRYENITEDSVIEGTLLNSPFQDFGVDAGDKVRFFPYEYEGEIVLICNLDSEK